MNSRRRRERFFSVAWFARLVERRIARAGVVVLYEANETLRIITDEGSFISAWRGVSSGASFFAWAWCIVALVLSACAARQPECFSWVEVGCTYA